MLCVGVLWGILVAVVLSLIMILYRIARPHDALLDEVDAAGGTVYRGVGDKETPLTAARPDRVPVSMRRWCLRTRRSSPSGWKRSWPTRAPD